MSWLLPEKQTEIPLPSGRLRVVRGLPDDEDQKPQVKTPDPVLAKYRNSPKRRAWLEKNRQRLLEYHRSYSKNNRERINAKARARYAKDPSRRAYLNVKQREYRSKDETQT